MSTWRRRVRERKARNKRDRWIRAFVGAYPGRPARCSLAPFVIRVVNNGYAKMFFPQPARCGGTDG